MITVHCPELKETVKKNIIAKTNEHKEMKYIEMAISSFNVTTHRHTSNPLTHIYQRQLPPKQHQRLYTSLTLFFLQPQQSLRPPCSGVRSAGAAAGCRGDGDLVRLDAVNRRRLRALAAVGRETTVVAVVVGVQLQILIQTVENHLLGC